LLLPVLVGLIIVVIILLGLIFSLLILLGQIVLLLGLILLLLLPILIVLLVLLEVLVPVLSLSLLLLLLHMSRTLLGHSERSRTRVAVCLTPVSADKVESAGKFWQTLRGEAGKPVSAAVIGMGELETGRTGLL